MKDSFNTVPLIVLDRQTRGHQYLTSDENASGHQEQQKKIKVHDHHHCD